VSERLTAEQRSAVMARVKGRDTGPELKLRRLLHGDGYRYRLHAPELPGRPDLVFRRRRAAVFVHGCFWHGHACPRGARAPKTNADYWTSKIARNRDRDAQVEARLTAQGWSVVIVWECELKSPAEVLARLQLALGPPQAALESAAPASAWAAITSARAT
jgi:DNA mismatch endonuclease (patch repair protein)